MSKTTFYHAGCPVCVNAEEKILTLVDTQKTNIEIVHLGQSRNRIAEAEKAGVKSMPALVTEDGTVLHINYGASLDDVKKN